MGLVAISAKDLQRLQVLTGLLAGRRSVASAATVLAISDRQVNRLQARYRDGGGGALIHRARGRTYNKHLKAGVREYAVELIRQSYRDFGPTLATEALHERHEITVGRETVRKWMVDAGVWLSRKQRRTFHQPRLRRESYGELVQIDGSDHRWFEDRAEPCTLLVFIGDATSKLMQLRFVEARARKPTSLHCAAISRIMAALLRFYSDSTGVPAEAAEHQGTAEHDAVRSRTV